MKLLRRPHHEQDIQPSDITPEALFHARRDIMRLGVLATGSLLLPTGALLNPALASPAPGTPRKSPLSSSDSVNSFKDITTYNNFYELGTDKAEPARHASALRSEPWTLLVDGEVKRPRTFDLDALRQLAPLEERIYRLRCVEAWSMVIPWMGYSLAQLLKAVEPTSAAKYVSFTSIHAPETLPGQKNGWLDWPYREGLRLDEAMHPLTLLGLGLYGQWLPNQNGAPVRLVVPWKYGFKSAKSIVRITLTREQPRTSWAQAAPLEYGFFANVNPQVDHPRWSQAKERRLGEFFRRPTLMFNGYAEAVAGLYTGMDLRRYF